MEQTNFFYCAYDGNLLSLKNGYYSTYLYCGCNKNGKVCNNHLSLREADEIVKECTAASDGSNIGNIYKTDKIKAKLIANTEGVRKYMVRRVKKC